MKYVKIYFASLLTFLVLDAIWLGWLANSIYQNNLGEYMSTQPDWIAAGIFYPLFIAGLLYFSILPYLEQASSIVLQRGFAFGIITYATYELTNKAVLPDWPWMIVPIDILWGGVLCCAAAYAGWWVHQKWN